MSMDTGKTAVIASSASLYQNNLFITKCVTLAACNLQGRSRQGWQQLCILAALSALMHDQRSSPCLSLIRFSIVLTQHLTAMCMCQHIPNNCAIHLDRRLWACCRLSSSVSCRTVDLVAKQAHKAGDPLLLDYGDKSLQDMLLQYGFVPEHNSCNAISEEYEDFGSCWQHLTVQNAGQVSILTALHDLACKACIDII